MQKKKERLYEFSIYTLRLSKSKVPNRNFDSSSSRLSLPNDVASVLTVLTVVRVTSVSSEVVVAPTLRIVGVVVECANEGMGPNIDTRFGPSGVGNGSSSNGESRPDPVVLPKAETEGEIGPSCRRPNEEREPERMEPELAVCMREWADWREELEPEGTWEDIGTEPEEREYGLKAECSEPRSETIR